MERLVTSNLKLGIIAGGQLAKMLIQDSSKWDIISYVLDGDDHCPARWIANHFVQGSRLDEETVYRFGKLVDVLTFEIESVNVAALKRLKAEGLYIAPDPAILELIQDKGLQKEFYRQHAIPTAPFRLYESARQIREEVQSGRLKIPFVQKLRKGGYDGRGVAVIDSVDDLEQLLEGSSVVEEKIDIDREVSVIAARNRNGEIRCFPVVEMVFDPKANLVDRLFCPSSLDEVQIARANEIASELVRDLQMEGLLAVEFFVDHDGQLLVNEVAPRPHNSGHHTIESVVTSQFEQHLRAVLNLPLGSTAMKLPAVMVNILGAEGYEGPVRYEGLTESLAIEGVKIHLYGKKITRPYRKMGHVTIIDRSLERAQEKADMVKRLIRVTAWDNRL